jgi:hypothetical protein
MEQKSVLFGFIALITSAILTFILVTLVMNPFSYGVYAPDAFLTDEEKAEIHRVDSLMKDSIRLDMLHQEALRIAQFKKDSTILDSIRQDSLKRVNLVQSVYIYDKLNYTLSTISVKRDQLLLQDSIYKIWEVADNYKTRGDSISSLISSVTSSGNRTIDSLQKIVLDLNKKVEQSQKVIQEMGVELQKAKEVPPPPPSVEYAYTEEQVTGYSKAYETMDPETVAKQMELMHEDDALDILINLQPRAAGRILDKMEPKKAAKIWLNLNSKKER